MVGCVCAISDVVTPLAPELALMGVISTPSVLLATDLLSLTVFLSFKALKDKS